MKQNPDYRKLIDNWLVSTKTIYRVRRSRQSYGWITVEARRLRRDHPEAIAAIEAAARASAEAVTVEGLANALHAVDDDVQFIRRDARNLPVLAGRILAALAATPAEPHE